MHRTLAIVVVSGLGLCVPRPVVRASDDGILRTFFKTHCTDCHDADGAVDLSVFSSVDQLQRQPELLTKIRRVVRDGDMPPPGEGNLPGKDRDDFLARVDAWWATSLRDHAVPPRTPVRRMNRFQYASAVEDILGLKSPVYWLPEAIVSDQSGYFNPQSGRMPDEVKVHNRLMGRLRHVPLEEKAAWPKNKNTLPPLSDVLSPQERVPFPQDQRATNGFDNRADMLSMSPQMMDLFVKRGRAIFQSPDLGPKTCGTWEKYFAPPSIASPPDAAAFRDRLRAFLTAAFRGPVEAETLDRYTAFAAKRIEAGGDFSSAMKAAAGAAIASPRFLYLGEAATSGDRPEPVTAVELASRISFFLWSSGPDEELLSAAVEGRLGDDAAIAAQVDRMMNSVRMKRFCDAFASQWLRIDGLINAEPDHKLFKDFYAFGENGRNAGIKAKAAGNHLMVEPLLVFETVFIENRGISQFIQSDFSYRSQPMVAFLAGEKVRSGDERTVSYKRVPIANKREGGVLTTAGVMTLTSGPRETHPISRGKWIIETLFNDPPPPPNVPPLDELKVDAEKKKSMSLREKFALHRTDATCMGCHTKIDPLGFAMENYDPVGRWRDDYGSDQPIDAGGVLFNRIPFKTIEEFKDGLLSEQPRFARGFAGHLMKYALCRDLGATDQPAIERIVAATAADGFRLRDMMKQVVLSEPFRTKFNPP